MPEFVFDEYWNIEYTFAAGHCIGLKQINELQGNCGMAEN